MGITLKGGASRCAQFLKNALAFEWEFWALGSLIRDGQEKWRLRSNMLIIQAVWLKEPAAS